MDNGSHGATTRRLSQSRMRLLIRRSGKKNNEAQPHANPSQQDVDLGLCFFECRKTPAHTKKHSYVSVIAIVNARLFVAVVDTRHAIRASFKAAMKPHVLGWGDPN